MHVVGRNIFHYKSKLNRRAFLCVVLVLLIGISFWAGSRYPALGEKAGLGADNDFAAIAFDQIVSVSNADIIVWQVLGNTINWAYTNKQGMTFGILFGAAIMNLFQLYSNLQLKGRMANTMLGMFAGAPLGVCVNCAVPIAIGSKKAGARTETALGILLSSPTLNVVVLSMTFALLPFWMASLRLGMTLGFILFMVPVAVWIARPREEVQPKDLENIIAQSPTVFDHVTTADAGVHERIISWPRALCWVVETFAKNLWFIIRISVPLMLLAGALGSLVITLFPWEDLVNSLPETGKRWMVGLLLAALLGTFLPVPIAFDVVVCAVLLAAGLKESYVATLLVTLGLFSVYPALQISQSISRKLAVTLFAMVVMFGFVFGLVSEQLAASEEEKKKLEIARILSHLPEEPLTPKVTRIPAKSADDIFALINSTQIDAGEPVQTQSDTIDVVRWKLLNAATPSNSTDPLFNLTYGPEIGLDEADNLSYRRYFNGLDTNRAIATGDVHQDGFADILTSSESGLSLYANLAGKRFERQYVATSSLDGMYLTYAAFADANGDGNLDILVGTRNEGVFLFMNDAGRFDTEPVSLIAPQANSVTNVLAFADLNQDNTLDIFVGNVAIGNNLVDRSTASAQNHILYFKNNDWQLHALPGPEGETLSALLSDVNNDGMTDVFIGNDFRPPDQLLVGVGEGNFEHIDPQQIANGTTRFTMSIASGDIDGDLVPEIYLGNISGRRDALPLDPKAQCKFETGQYRSDCENHMETSAAFVKVRQTHSVAPCKTLRDRDLMGGCAVLALAERLLSRGPTGPEAMGDLCDKVPAHFPDIQQICWERRKQTLSPLTDEEKRPLFSGDLKSNMLLKKMPANQGFTDTAAHFGLENAGWTWNARFADLNLNGDLDLYVVNGHSLAAKRYQHKLFMNTGSRFEDRAVEEGIASGNPATSYSYVDLDRDGDLDIVTVPLIGSIKVFYNQAAQRGAHPIQIALRQDVHNQYAVGAKVIVHYGDEIQRSQIREIQASGGFMSQDEPIAVFGLGKYDQINALEILWPDGQKTKIPQPLKAGYRYQISRQ